jgi:P4 family phage/plasmid primase-like protien
MRIKTRPLGAPVQSGKTLGDFLDEELYPALYERLDEAFPAFGWKKQGRAWVATRWPEDFPFVVEHPHPDRLVVYEDGPGFIMIHGHHGLSWTQYLADGETPTGAAFGEVLKGLAAKAGVTLPGRKLDAVEVELQRYHDERRKGLGLTIEMGKYLLQETKEGDQAVDYLIERGFAEEDMEQLGLGFYTAVEHFENMFQGEGCDLEVARKAGLLWPKLEGYILVPWLDAVGRPLTLYGRWFEKTPPEGRPKTIALPGAGTKASPLYFDRARRAGHRHVVAVEGDFDGGLLQARGESRAVAYVGAQFSQGQVATLSKHGVQAVTIVPDPDGGGDRGAMASVEMLERAGIRSYVAPRLPDGLDPDEFLVKAGLEGWKAHVDRAIPGTVHKAAVMLQEVSPDSSEAERRAGVEGIAVYAKSLQGNWANEDRQRILEHAAEVTGFEAEKLMRFFGTAVAEGSAEGPHVEQQPLEGDFHHTDMGNAARLAQRHGRDLKCVSGVGWLVWNGARWLRDETGEVERRAKETVRAMYDEAAATEDDAARLALVNHARKSEGVYRITAMVTLARSEPQLVARAADLDANPYLLNVLNGTVDLRTGQLLPHRREDLITQLAPVEYAAGARCPQFLAFLDEIFDENPDLIAFMQRAIGYALTGDVSEQVFFYLYGTGANGKSTLLLLMMFILGSYAKQSAPNLLVAKRGEEHPTGVADLHGARLVVTTEIESGRSMAESLVKQMTGGDKMKARFMRQDFFEFDPLHKVWLAANHKLLVKGSDHGLWRRVHLVPFTVTIPEERRDKKLLQKLKAEASGILAWAVRGCLAWQRDGLGTPEEVVAATAEYREEMDTLSQFIEECCEVGDALKVNAGALYEAYKDWCNKSGEYVTSQRVFGERLTERGFAPDKGTGGTRIRLGLRLNAGAGVAGGGSFLRISPNVFNKSGRAGTKGH